MSIIDVLTKWTLGKIDETLFAKKDISTEARLRVLYDFMKPLPKVCEDLAVDFRSYSPRDDKGCIEKNLDDFDYTAAQLKEIGYDEVIKEARARITKFRKNPYAKKGKTIVQDVQNMQLDFDSKKESRGLSDEIIKQLADFEFFLIVMAAELSDYQIAIEAEDEDAFLNSSAAMFSEELGLRHHADKFRKIIDKILEFSTELKI